MEEILRYGVWSDYVKLGENNLSQDQQEQLKKVTILKILGKKLTKSGNKVEYDEVIKAIGLPEKAYYELEKYIRELVYEKELVAKLDSVNLSIEVLKINYNEPILLPGESLQVVDKSHVKDTFYLYDVLSKFKKQQLARAYETVGVKFKEEEESAVSRKRKQQE